jgi:hypothetical protein
MFVRVAVWLLLFALSVQASDWTNYGGNNARNGQSPEHGIGPDGSLYSLNTTGQLARIDADTGALDTPAAWPTGVPIGFEFWVQHWITDAGGPAGFAASNGLAALTP